MVLAAHLRDLARSDSMGAYRLHNVFAGIAVGTGLAK